MGNETKQRRIARGLCGFCGQEPLATKVRGANCNARMLEYSAKVVRMRKAAKRCQRCNWPGVKPGCTHCDTCLLDRNEKALQRHRAQRQELALLREEVEALRVQLASKGGQNDSAICGGVPPSRSDSLTTPLGCRSFLLFRRPFGWAQRGRLR